jgi:lipid-A-disaccharide synthase
VKKIAGIVNRMAVILPFEEQLYKNAGLPCEFVGHPITEEIETVLKSSVNSQQASVKDNRVGNLPHPPLEKGGKRGFENLLKADMKTALGFLPDRPLLALLPGSRPHELQKLLPVMLDVIRKVRNEPDMNAFNEYQFCMPLAPNTDETTYSLLFEDLKREGVTINKGESVRVLAASDLAVVASGTATLQTALLEVPMVVVYKLSPLTYHLGRRIIKVNHISLVNILSGKTVVRELLQEEANPEEIIKELKKILLDIGYREEMLSYYSMVRKQFQGKHASKRVAEIVTEMMREK